MSHNCSCVKRSTGLFRRKGPHFVRWWEQGSCEHVSNYAWLTRRNISIWRALFIPPSLSHFCLWGCMKSEVYKRKADTRWRIARSHFGCCCPRQFERGSIQTKNTRSSCTSLKVHGGRQCNFRTFIVNCNKFVIQTLN
jgi:hypothetical protein